MTKLLHWISSDSTRRFGFALIVAVSLYLCIGTRFRFITSLIATWDAFAVVVLGLAWSAILLTPQTQLREYARRQDFGRLLLFVFVVAASCIALFSVAFLIRTHHAESAIAPTSHLCLALSTVALSWCLLHTIFSFHYAHIFYGDDSSDASGHAGGLSFPEQSAPDYSDFAYFSFVIGMTCQVSDVQVTSQTMRRLTLLHGMLSFGYNTIILALLINTVSGLL